MRGEPWAKSHTLGLHGSFSGAGTHLGSKQDNADQSIMHAHLSVSRNLFGYTIIPGSQAVGSTLYLGLSPLGGCI